MFLLLILLTLSLAASKPTPRINYLFSAKRADYGPPITEELTKYGEHLGRVIRESVGDENDPMCHFLLGVIARCSPIQAVDLEDHCQGWARAVDPTEKDSKAHAATNESLLQLVKCRRGVERNTQHFPYDHAQALLTYHALIAYHFSLMRRAQEYLEEAHPNHDFRGFPRTDARICRMLIDDLPDTVQTEIRKAYIAFCNPTARGYSALYPEGTKTHDTIVAALNNCQLWGTQQHVGVTKLVAEYAQPTHFQLHDFRTLLRNRTEIDFVGIDSLKGITRLSNENRTLETLGFLQNYLTEIPEQEFAIVHFPALINLDFTGNKITHVPATVLTSCPNLRSLVLSGNPITQLTPEFCTAVAQHPKLAQLYLLSCPLDAASREAITKACGEKVKLALDPEDKK